MGPARIFLVLLVGLLWLGGCQGTSNSAVDVFDGYRSPGPVDGGSEDRESPPPIAYDFHVPLPIPDHGSLADPHVIKVDDTWYLYGTHSQAGFEVWSSNDLSTWVEGPTVWSPTLPWQTRADLCGMWAPHVESTEDGYFLYYTANCRIGVAHSKSPLGPFEEVHQVPLVGNGQGGIGDGELADDLLFDWDDMAIDAFLLQSSQGALFLYFTALSPLSEIYGVSMSNFVTLNGAPTKLLAADVQSWEGMIREGVWVLEREGSYQLMYSGNQYDTVDYGVGVATSLNPLGPFVRDERNPILKTNLATGLFGPGHHSVVAGATNDLLFFYHTKVESTRGDARMVRYGPLWFDAAGLLQLEQP